MPGKIFTFSDARKHAKRRMPKMTFDYVDGSALDENTCRMNVDAIDMMRLLPRVMVNVEKRNLGKSLFGDDWDLPFGIAPMGMCNLTWPGADAMLARAAMQYRIPIVLSTMASSSIEQTAERTQSKAWFQLYVGQSEEVAFDLVRRAEEAGYRHLILTVDVPEIGMRPRERRNGFKSPLRIGPRQFFDFATHPRWSIQSLMAGVPKLANVNIAGGKELNRNEARGKVDWALLDRLRARWQGPLMVKGVLNAPDAVRIRDAGVDAVYVSNHGGRQLDSAPPAIRMLPVIRDAVGPDYPLLFDSGVRNGEAVVKALALGADYVFVGRPLLYAMGADGYAGLQDMIELIREQISITLAQLGCPDVNDIDGSYLLDAGLSER
jgi:L-lactate dehydrogenase (cytochrome)